MEVPFLFMRNKDGAETYQMGFCSWWIPCDFCRIWFVGNFSQTRNGVTRFKKKKKETRRGCMHRKLVIPTRPILNVSSVTRSQNGNPNITTCPSCQLMWRKNCKSLSDRNWVIDSNVIRCWFIYVFVLICLSHGGFCVIYLLLHLRLNISLYIVFVQFLFWSF